MLCEFFVDAWGVVCAGSHLLRSPPRRWRLLHVVARLGKLRCRPAAPSRAVCARACAQHGQRRKEISFHQQRDRCGESVRAPPPNADATGGFAAAGSGGQRGSCMCGALLLGGRGHPASHPRATLGPQQSAGGEALSRCARARSNFPRAACYASVATKSHGGCVPWGGGGGQACATRWCQTERWRQPDTIPGACGRVRPRRRSGAHGKSL